MHRAKYPPAWLVTIREDLVTTRLIVDTDIGTDVDDCLALAFILGSPELELAGLTCVYGDVALRGRMLTKLLRLSGRDDVPVVLGASEPLLGLRDVYWGGHEGVGLLDDGDADLTPAPGHAVDFIVETVMADPGQIHLLAIGPLTNVALTFKREPLLARALAHLTIMGGVFRGPDAAALPYAEHNFVCDPEAAHIVLTAGAPITLVPLDVTTRVKITTAGTRRLRARGTPFHTAVADQVERYPRFAQKGATALHDPLAAAIILRPDLVTLRPLHVDIETGGRLSAGLSLMRSPSANEPMTADVALDIDVAAAETFVIDRIAS